MTPVQLFSLSKRSVNTVLLEHVWSLPDLDCLTKSILHCTLHRSTYLALQIEAHSLNTGCASSTKRGCSHCWSDTFSSALPHHSSRFKCQPEDIAKQKRARKAARYTWDDLGEDIHPHCQSPIPEVDEEKLVKKTVLFLPSQTPSSDLATSPRFLAKEVAQT